MISILDEADELRARIKEGDESLSPSSRARLRLIVKTLRECGQAATYAAVAEQFHYETGQYPSKDDVEKVIG